MVQVGGTTNGATPAYEDDLRSSVSSSLIRPPSVRIVRNSADHISVNAIRQNIVHGMYDVI